MTAAREHVLVLYRASERADATLQEVARRIRNAGRLTVVALAAQEPTGRRCCDTRSVLWNGFTREFAREDLKRARSALGETENVEFAVLPHEGRRVADAGVDDARRRGVSEIVVADPRACGLSRRAQRRLLANGAG